MVRGRVARRAGHELPRGPRPSRANFQRNRQCRGPVRSLPGHPPTARPSPDARALTAQLVNPVEGACLSDLCQARQCRPGSPGAMPRAALNAFARGAESSLVERRVTRRQQNSGNFTSSTSASQLGERFRRLPGVGRVQRTKSGDTSRARPRCRLGHAVPSPTRGLSITSGRLAARARAR